MNRTVCIDLDVKFYPEVDVGRYTIRSKSQRQHDNWTFFIEFCIRFGLNVVLEKWRIVNFGKIFDFCIDYVSRAVFSSTNVFFLRRMRKEQNNFNMLILKKRVCSFWNLEKFSTRSVAFFIFTLNLNPWSQSLHQIWFSGESLFKWPKKLFDYAFEVHF